MANRNERVLQCEDGSFCCGTRQNASDCCKQRFVDWISNVTSTAHEPISTSILQTSNVASTAQGPTATSILHASVLSLFPTHSIDPHTTASRPHSSPSSTINPERTRNEPGIRAGIIAGACLGGVIGILVLFGIIAWIVRRRRRQFKGDEDSVVILDHVLPDRTLPPSFRPYRVQKPPEVHWSEMSRLNERVVYVDKVANAVMDMGF